MIHNKWSLFAQTSLSPWCIEVSCGLVISKVHVLLVKEVTDCATFLWQSEGHSDSVDLFCTRVKCQRWRFKGSVHSNWKKNIFSQLLLSGVELSFEVLR